MERVEKEQKQAKSSVGQEMSPIQMAKVVGNQAIIQKSPSDPDPDFILDPADVLADEQMEELDYADYLEEIMYNPEDVPSEYAYHPLDGDCYMEDFNYSCVSIDMQGSRARDYDEADMELHRKHSEYDSSQRSGFTWHHMLSLTIGICDMVLVKSNVHNSIYHFGAVHQYERQKHKDGDRGFKYG